MAGILMEDHGDEANLSSAEVSGSIPSETLAEWRSSSQIENGTPSTSPFWDTDDEDDDGLKPSDLSGKFTWKIENFFQLNKRELRSNAFEVGGYKWYILIYPQGCDVSNHLSLFLCVANHDKLLPGWNHFAQFTIVAVNKEPKKSKHSDTLHRFWKKEHDWGWKKFLELSKLSDGFISQEALTIRAQVQVIREKADRPFRCLDCRYRRELIRAYLVNVDQIFRRFIDERRAKICKFIEDKVRWSSFCSFWSGLDQDIKRQMSRSKMENILKIVVKHFFIEKEVTSTLVMDSLYSGMRVLEYQNGDKKLGTKVVDMEEFPAPLVFIEKDMFVLVDDIVPLLERVAMERFPYPHLLSKDDSSHYRSKDVSSVEETIGDCSEYERRLTVLGHKTIEIYVLAHIFSNRIEISYQEAIALKRQEELIREEEAAWQAESNLKARRAAEKEKRTKKKQAKQKKNARRARDKGKDEKSEMQSGRKLLHDANPSGQIVQEDFSPKQRREILGINDKMVGRSDESDLADEMAESLQPDLYDGAINTLNSDTDASEIHPNTEINGQETQNGHFEKPGPCVMEDSSSTCSTDSVLSLPMNGIHKMAYKETQSSSKRGKDPKDLKGKDRLAKASFFRRPALSDDTCDSESICDSSTSTGHNDVKATISFKDQMDFLEKGRSSSNNSVIIEGPPEKKPMEEPSSSSLGEKTILLKQSRQLLEPSGTNTEDPVSIGESSSLSSSSSTSAVLLQSKKSTPLLAKSPVPPIPRAESHKFSSLSKSSNVQPVNSVSRPLSAPLNPSRKPSAPPICSAPVQTTAPLLSRSISASGRLGGDPSSLAPNPLSYRNAIMSKTGSDVTSTSQNFTLSQTSPAFGPPSSMPSFQSTTSTTAGKEGPFVRPGFTFGTVRPEILLHNFHPRKDSSSQKLGGYSGEESINFGAYGGSWKTATAAASAWIPPSVKVHDEFPHLDIINDLLDEEQVFSEHPDQFHGAGLEAAYISFNGLPNGPLGMPHLQRRTNGSAHNHWPPYAQSDAALLSLGNGNASGYPYHRAPDYSNRRFGDQYATYRPSKY